MTFEKRSTAGYFMRRQGWVYALLVVAGIGLGAYEISSYQTVSRFAVEGVDSLGLVTRKSEYMYKNNKKSYRLSYTFPTSADPYNHGMQEVSETFYDSQAADAEIMVRYLPTDPSINAVEPGNIAKGFWVGLIASIGLILGGIAGGAYAMYRALKGAH